MNFDFLNECSTSNRHNLFVIHCGYDDLPKAIKEFEAWGIPVVNVGKTVAEKVKEIGSSKFLNLELQEFVERMIEHESRIINEDQPEVVALHNIGILLEPQLGLDASTILKDASKRTTIMILWENQIEPPARLHWAIAKDRFVIDFSDISQLRIHSYEI